MPTITATCPLCNKTVEVDVPSGSTAIIDHYNNDRIVIRPRVIPIK